jgi:hypothetical protein
MARQFVTNTWMGGSGTMWAGAHVSSGTHNAIVGEFIFADTTSATVGIYLPENPEDCDVIPLRRVAGGLTLTVYGNGHEVENFLSPMSYGVSTVVNVNGTFVQFVYNASLKKWHLLK